MRGIICLLIVIHTVYSERAFINLGGFICPREEKALGRCLRDALNSYIPKLVTGVPEFDIPPCEPLVIPAMRIEQSEGPVTVVSSYTDITVRGPSTMKIKNVNIDSSKNKIVAQLHIPELRLKGNYDLKGKFLMIPIEGDGKFTAKYGNIDATVTIILGRRPRPDAVDALACKDLDVKFHAGHASVRLDNLFGGEGDLGRAINKLLNENWEQLSQEFQGPIETALRDFFKPLADHSFGTLNADDIL